MDREGRVGRPTGRRANARAVGPDGDAHPRGGKQAGAASGDAVELPPWVLRQRISLPARSPGFFRRSALADRCAPTARRLTLLVAPGGFGKTSLLVECCRDALERGVPTAWLRLDRDDEPEMLDAYLAHSARQAGLDVLESFRANEPAAGVRYPRTALLLHAVEASADPFVMALDEAECLASRGSVALLSFLLRSAPANLHVAIAARELPPGLDVLSPPLASEPMIVTADDLRFGRDDIMGFFDNGLSRRELARLSSASLGWPIALRIHRNERRPGSGQESRVLRDAVRNWVESRLWPCFAEADREFLLDIGLFDWLDGPLLETVLGDPGAMRRLEGMRMLDGLAERVRGDAMVRLHPLIRDYCAAQRRRDDPGRYASIHAGIARALAARGGRTLEAMRHAAESGDTGLLAAILEGAGGVRIGLREGIDHLVAANRLVPDDAIARHPRLGVVRCAALAATGRLASARRLFESLPRGAPEIDAGDDAELYLDRCLARAIIAHFGCESAYSEETRAMYGHASRLAGRSAADPAITIGIELMLCILTNLGANFDEAADHGHRLRMLGADRAPFVAPAIEIQFGLMAMAQGRIGDAMGSYQSAQRLAQERFLHVPRLTLLTKLLLWELEFERNRLAEGIATGSLSTDFAGGAELAAYFAASDIAVETALGGKGVDGALAAVDGMLAHARKADLRTLRRHLAATRVSLLADAGRIDPAERTWAAAELPDNDADCVDLEGQCWRELESVSCARLRLLAARGEFHAGRQLVEAVLRVADERRLRRTEMRARILGMKLEHLAGSERAALSHLAEFLELFAETDYARALVREGGLAATMLRRFLATRADSPNRGAAEQLLEVAAEGRTRDVARLTGREVDVMLRLDQLPDHEIATALGITRHGVRYHVRNIFRKLGVRNRGEAVRRARESGILPSGE